MSTLVIQLPEHRRLRARRDGRRRRRRRAAARVRLRHQRRRHRVRGPGPGRRGAAADALAVVIAVRPARPTSAGIASRCPRRRRRACARRWSACIEEALLEDADAVHLASRRRPSPASRPGSPRSTRPGCSSELAALQKAGVFVDRVVPMAWPDDPPTGHFHVGLGRRRRPAQASLLTWANVDGVATVRLDGGLARALVPQPAPRDDALDRVADRRGRGRAVARRAGDGDADRAAPAAGRRAASGTCASSTSRGAPAARAPLRDWAAPGDEPGVAAGAHRPGRCWSSRRSSASTSGPGTRRAPSRRAAPRSRRWSRQTFPRVARRRHPARRRAPSCCARRRRCARSPARPATATSSRCCRPPPRPGRASGRRSRTCASSRAS